jgi:leucyl-tRNA synthetase
MILGEDGQKMSKSRGNVVNPDKVIADYGADSMRLYEMFMGPLEAIKPWSMQGVEGVHRFLQRAWRVIIDEDTGELAEQVKEAEADEETLRLLNRKFRFQYRYQRYDDFCKSPQQTNGQTESSH